MTIAWSGRKTQLGVAMAMLLSLAACDETGSFNLSGPAGQSGDATRSVERDIEAPNVYQLTDIGLWDGRPSLGGVWVAEPDVTDPERVIIRNELNGSFVIGALFRRERNTPGPRLQVSSDAAEALGMLAGQTAKLNVTALRRQEVAPEPELPSVSIAGGDISQEVLTTTAAEAIAAAEAAGQANGTTEIQPRPQPATSSGAALPASGLTKPFVQIGIFSIEQNARNTATSLRNAGLIPTVRAQTGNGKPFWRVVVGPAPNSADRSNILSTVKGLGFSDAYFVTN